MIIKRLEEKKINLLISENTIHWISKRGYDPIYGARPIKRVIQTEIENPLANLLLKSKLETNKKIEIDVDRDVLSFKKVESQD